MGNTGSFKEITTVTLQTGTARNRKHDDPTKDKTIYTHGNEARGKQVGDTVKTNHG